MSVLIDLIRSSWSVLEQMAPYLLFGFLMAGLLSVFIRQKWVERHLGGGGLWPVVKASLVGVPMPLCSCGVLPVSAALKKQGASRAAAASFLISTPQTGVDSILITYALLGPFFAVFRPVTSFLAGIAGGALVRYFDKRPDEVQTEMTKKSCCSVPMAVAPEKSNPLARSLKYGFGTLPREIGPVLLLGVVIAGALASFVHERSLAAYIGGGAGSILIMMAAGVPVYVCATASVPIAAGLMHLGASPGAALAFLIAGPATNAATFTTIVKVLGKTTAFLYLATIAVSAFGFGLLMDVLFPLAGAELPALGSHAHESGGWVYTLAACALLVLIAGSFVAKLKKRSPPA